MERVLFHEITKRAVQEAIAHPRPLDHHLIDSQQARRVLDRLVGYKLSPLLWDKVRRGLSAGRVQSVALKMICDREAEIEAFVPEEYWHLDARLAAGQPPSFVARLAQRDGKKFVVHDGETAAAVKTEVERERFVVAKVAKRRRQQKAAPPFVTAKLQQAAYKRHQLPGAKDHATGAEALRGRGPGRRGARWASSPTCAPTRCGWRRRPSLRRVS